VRVRDLESGRESVPVSIPATTTTTLEPRLSPDASLLIWSEMVERQPVSFLTSLVEPSRRELCRGCVGLSFLSSGEEALFLRPPNRIVRLRLTDTTETPVVDGGMQRILGADVSWDDRWLVVSSGRTDGTVTFHVLPVSGPPAAPSEWLQVQGGSDWRGSPRWSADGRLLYYLSDRDGFICLWAQPLDPASKQPSGEPFPVLHAHDNRMKMITMIRETAGISVGRRRVVINASELTGEIYTAMLEPG
jgi:Tol biopolymer transport system component